MRLVHQIDGNSCQHACIAMLANVDLFEVLGFAAHKKYGLDIENERQYVKYPARLDVSERWACFERFDIVAHEFDLPIASYGGEGKSLHQLLKEYRTLFCSVYDSRVREYAHAVLIHDQVLYCPWFGTNPSWPWSRFIAKVTPIFKAPCHG